jgi:hypothetical protein
MPEMTDFQQKLILTVVDKALIGAALVVAGFMLNRTLERFKSRLALTNDFAKQRVVKIAEIWTSLYTLEEDLRLHSAHVAMSVFRLKPDEDVSVATAQYTEKSIDLEIKAKAMKASIAQNRFWLGDELSSRFDRYQQILLGHAHVTLNQPRELRADVVGYGLPMEELQMLRRSVLDYMRGGA